MDLQPPAQIFATTIYDRHQRQSLSFLQLVTWTKSNFPSGIRSAAARARRKVDFLTAGARHAGHLREMRALTRLVRCDGSGKAIFGN
jgi:hypothetical protein